MAESDLAVRLGAAKNKIKEKQCRIITLCMNITKKLVGKSVNDTLKEIKLCEYAGAITYCSNVSETEVLQRLCVEWDEQKLNEWRGPNLDAADMNDDIAFEKAALEFGAENAIHINHVFWELMLRELFAYCHNLSVDYFPEQVDQNAQHTLQKCLFVCVVLDLLKATVIVDNKKHSLLPKKLLINNVRLQNALNEHMDIKFDIEQWRRPDMDDKKVFQRCGTMLQKEAMKCGKEFVKLHKLHKLRKRKEKKQKEKELQTQLQAVQEAAKKSETEELKAEDDDDEDDDVRAEKKDDFPVPSTPLQEAPVTAISNPSYTYIYVMIILVAIIAVILGVLLRFKS
mmetsp:Transcript_36635/g.60311  ORF Transcript_36635/g.60311 Transcript_36635/m.60311 type:complete len:341 (-) Transcript_36635:83-1105(-)|eukprot:CAMPEP_0202693436 /NCGR_PEP_ID=MMETSP1385-20130828/7556_1 /ASSEMBLY_ACC=CAM_ASM_000861 /TAXON_ID=933848 /ORGANISM="Elphidium margaritaceum" /LENGTH=340 /DNA_ID=CAMNT_0049349115 /DNA_START=12 /DNA_END=1034 /DNA_ORIENTATION=+